MEMDSVNRCVNCLVLFLPIRCNGLDEMGETNGNCRKEQVKYFNVRRFNAAIKVYVRLANVKYLNKQMHNTQANN
jgi:hypothetical protein